MTTALLFAAAFAVVAVLVYLARYSGRVSVVRTRVIEAPWQETYARVVDLRRWPEWSPWLEHQPDVVAVHSGRSDSPGGAFRWKRGADELGEVEHLRIRAPGRIEQRLRLGQPFPLRGLATWEVADREGRTSVTWSLRGKVAFSMRAFAPTVQGAVALDFRYGLDRLAALVERSDAPRYSLTYEGIRDIAALRYAYVEHTARIDGLAQARRVALGELHEALTRLGVAAAGAPLTLYAETRARQRTTRCRFAFPISDADIGGLAIATVPAHRAFVASLLGSDAQLELAWYLTMRRLGALGIQPDLRLMPSEQYPRTSALAPGNADLIEIRIPVLPR